MAECKADVAIFDENHLELHAHGYLLLKNYSVYMYNVGSRLTDPRSQIIGQLFVRITKTK